MRYLSEFYYLHWPRERKIRNNSTHLFGCSHNEKKSNQFAVSVFFWENHAH